MEYQKLDLDLGSFDLEPTWQSSVSNCTPLKVSFYSEIDVLRKEIEFQAETIELLRKQKPKEIYVRSVKALSCPCCNAPIVFKAEEYIADNKKALYRNCDYCGNLLEFQTKE